VRRFIFSLRVFVRSPLDRPKLGRENTVLPGFDPPVFFPPEIEPIDRKPNDRSLVIEVCRLADNFAVG
jgi:hypothetical protein